MPKLEKRPLEKLAYSRREAAFVTSLSESTIDNLIGRKVLTTISIGRRRLIPASDVKRMLRDASAGRI